MKKILMVMMMVSTFLFVSCKSSIEETYTVEGGLITETEADWLESMTEWKYPSYSNFSVVCDYLQSNSKSGFWSEVWTISEVEQFLLQRFSSTEKAKETIRFLKENGYQIILFNTNETDIVGWMSISQN